MSYSDILKQYVVRTNIDASCYKKVEQKKKNNGLSKEEYVAALKDFCKPTDLVGIVPTTGCAIFNRYLMEHGKPTTGRNTFSKMVRETFGLTTQVLKTDHGFYANVFIPTTAD